MFFYDSFAARNLKLMNRKEFISSTLSGILLMGLSSSLISCITDSIENDEIYSESSSDDKKTIFLISSGRSKNIKSKKLISAKVTLERAIAGNFVIFGYIAPTSKLVKVYSAKNNLKIFELDNKLSYVIFNQPVEMNLQESDKKQHFRYLDVEQMNDIKNFKTLTF
ncbi:hypothetical protein EDF65_3719 [Chryseobacterium nakagawai]|nr:hypothetical protein EDF65_3719 [Chryseobacterium nakagawai]